MTIKRVAVLFLGVVCSLLSATNHSGNIWAQDETAPPVRVEEGKAEAASTIFVPYAKLEAIFGKQGAAAILPYADLQKLMKLLEDHQPQPPQAVLTNSHYQVTVEKEIARIRATLSLRSMQEGWSSIRLPFQGAAVGKVTLDNEQAFFRGAGGGQYLVQLPAKGDYQLTLELLVKIQASPDKRRIAFQTPLSGITTAEVSVPTADQSINIKPEAITLPVEAADQTSKVKVNLGATDHIEISWTPKVSAKPQMELLTSVQNQTVVTLSDGLVHTEASLEVDVLRGELSEFQIVVPKSNRILGVTSNSVNVQRQTVEETENAKVITIKLLQGVSQKFTLEVHTEQPLPKDSFALAGSDEDGNVHGIYLRGAIRESGTLSVSHPAESRLVVEQQEGLMRVDGASVPKAVRDRANVHYKFYSPVFTLTGSIQPVQPRLQVRNETQHYFQKGALIVNAVLSYNIERAGVFDLEIKLPTDLKVETVITDNLREYTIDDATGVLKVSFNEKRLGAVQVHLKGRIDLKDEAESQLALPIPEPVGVFQETGTISVYAPQSLEIDTVEEETSGVVAEDATAQGNQRTRLVSLWSYQSRPLTVTVRTVRKPTRLSARLETYIEVNEDQAALQTKIRYQVEHAPVRFFRIEVPEEISELITIDVPPGQGQSIQSKTPADEAIDGWITWTIELTQEALGEQVFEVVYEIPLTREGDEQLSELQLTIAKALPALTDAENGEEIALVRTVGEVGIARDRSLSVSSEIDAERSESLDRRELTMAARASDQAYRYFTQPVSLTLRSRKYEIQNVVETVISRALVEVAVGYDPQATYRCRYLVNTSERQRLLVQLPVNADPLSVLVNGKRVDLEQADVDEGSDQFDSYYVNISQNHGNEEQLSLTLQFLWPINPPQFQGPLGTLQLGFPQIASQGGTAAIQQCRLAIWVPDKFHLVGTPTQFNDDQKTQISAALFGFPTSPPVDSDELNGWIQGVPTGAIEFPAEGIGYSFQTMGNLDSTRISWWEMHYMVWVLSGTLLVIGWLLKGTSWENRLGIVLLLVFLAAIYAVKDDDTIAHILAAARFGLLAVVALWGIQTCIGSSRLGHLNGAAQVATTGGVEESPSPVDAPADAEQSNDEEKPDQDS